MTSQGPCINCSAVTSHYDNVSQSWVCHECMGSSRVEYRVDKNADKALKATYRELGNKDRKIILRFARANNLTKVQAMKAIAEESQ